MSAPDPRRLGSRDDWSGVRVAVLGSGEEALAVADNLSHLGAAVTVQSAAETVADAERMQLLAILGVEFRLGRETATSLSAVDLLVVAPAGTIPETWPEEDLVAAAIARGVPVVGELELAWQLRDPESAPPWLAIAGGEWDTNGAVVELLHAMLGAAGVPAVASGSAGLSLVEAVMDPSPYAALIAGLDAHQLVRAGGFHAHSSALLDAGPDPLDSPFGRVFEGVEIACVYAADHPGTEKLVEAAEVVEGARAIGITLSTPGPSMLGLVEDVLADRAFVEDRHNTAAELATLADLRSDDPAYLEAVLAAAALARAFGVPPAAIRQALRAAADR